MFDAVASRYDLMNRLLSLSLDRGWRRQAVKYLLPVPGKVYLDIGTGTGDLLCELPRHAPGATVVGIDSSLGMLRVARGKLSAAGLGSAAPSVFAGDALRMPVADGAFDGAVSAFCLRNVESITGFLREIVRVLRPGASVAVLELTRPTSPVLRHAHRLYNRFWMPLLGGMLSRRSAYRFLAASITEFPDSTRIAARMADAGLAEVRTHELHGGIATVFAARRP